MIDVLLRIFIPSRAVLVPLPVIGEVGFDGDNRGGSYGEGTSRAEISIDVDNTPTSANPVTIKRRVFGESRMYRREKLDDVGGKPLWWKTVKRNPLLGTEELPDEIATAQLADNTLHASGTIENVDVFGLLKNVRVKFRVIATNPLEPLAPPINCDLDVLIGATGTASFGYSITGSHDGFPAYEIYFERRLVYSFDPVDAGTSPLNLLAVGDVAVNQPLTLFI